MDDSLSAVPPPSRAARAVWFALAGAAALLAAATLWAYAPVLDNGFVWDDGANLIAAREHWDQGLAGIVWAFTTPLTERVTVKVCGLLLLVMFVTVIRSPPTSMSNGKSAAFVVQ